MYQISLENFSGPIEKLLELIEQKKLDISSISLAEVTADFISYTQELKRAYEDRTTSQDDGERVRIYARLVSDFLVIAAQLLYIKSRTLLPQLPFEQDDERDAFNLEQQVRLYGALKPVFTQLKSFWTASDQSFAREYLRTVQPVFYPPAGITCVDIHDAFMRVTATTASFVREEQTVRRQLITLEEKIHELSQSLISGVQTFGSFVSAKSKHETIVLFLALLHLLRDRIVRAKQSDQFGDIEFETHTSLSDEV